MFNLIEAPVETLKMKRSTWLTKKIVVKLIAALVIGGAGISLASGLQAGHIKTGFLTDRTITTSEKRDSQGIIIESTTTTTPQAAKTLWDWLSLLGVPFSLAILGYLLQQLQQSKQQNEKKISESNKREEALQNYLDRVSQILIDKNLISTATKLQFIAKRKSDDNQPDPVGREEKELLNSETCVIRATTLSILRRLGEDGERKGNVIQFLEETGIMSKLHLDLSGANLSEANLSGANLKGAQLSESNLSGANLHKANLNGANLRKANLDHAQLHEANLSNTYLKGANLHASDLSKAYLCNAQITGANLHKANLTNASFKLVDLSFADFRDADFTKTDLRGADLHRARNLTSEQLAVATLENSDQVPRWITLPTQ